MVPNARWSLMKGEINGVGKARSEKWGPVGENFTGPCEGLHFIPITVVLLWYVLLGFVIVLSGFLVWYIYT